MAKQKLQKKSGADRTHSGELFPLRKNIYPLLVFVFSFLLFMNSIPNDYNLDDELVTENHRLTSKGIAAIPEIFTSPYYEDNMGYSYEYRPVVHTTFAIEHQFFGDNPHVSHFFNVLLYSLCCLILFRVLVLLLPESSAIVALGITLLFAAHSSHTEVVCSIKSRDEILALIFSLLCLGVAVRVAKSAQYFLLVFVPVLFAVALMSKATAVPFVFLIPLAVVFFTGSGIGLSLLTGALVQIPFFILLPSTSGKDKALIQLAAFALTTMCYYIINYKVFLQGMQRFSFYLKNFFALGLKQNEGSHEEILSNYHIRDVFKGIIPDKTIIHVAPIIVSVALGIACIFFIAQKYVFVSAIPLTLLLVFMWSRNSAYLWWGSTVFGFLLGFFLIFLHHNSSTYNFGYALAVAAAPYLAFTLVYGKRNLFLPTAAAFIFFTGTNFYYFGNYDSITLLIALLFTLNKKARYAMVVIVILVAVKRTISGNNTVADVLQSAIGLAIFFTTNFNKGKKIFLLALALLSVSAFYLYSARENNVIRAKDVANKTIDFVNESSPKIIARSQERPLEYAEACVRTDDPKSIRAGTSLQILSHYLYKVVLPYPLSFYYGYKFIYPQKIIDTVPMISLLLHLILFFIALLLLNKAREISFGIWIYLIAISSCSNYVQFIPGMLADRFLFVPSLGWCVILVFLTARVFRINTTEKILSWTSVPSAPKYFLLAILLLYSGITFTRNFNWKDDLTLFRNDINYVYQSGQAHNLLALHLMKRAEAEQNVNAKTEMQREALVHFKKALEIVPSFFNVAYDIGRTYMALQIPDSAILAFKYTLTIDTSFSDVQLNLADMLLNVGRYDEAIPYFRYVIKKRPADYIAYNKLSYLLFMQKKYVESINVNRAALQQITNLPDPFINIGRTFVEMKLNDSARVYLLKANEISPNNPQVLMWLRYANGK